MKMYRSAEGVWFRPGTINPKSADRVEIPTDSEGLVHWLNGYRSELTQPRELTHDEIRNSNTPEAQAAAKRLMEPTPINETVAKARTADDIVAFILDEAAVHQVENILAAIGTRFGELAKGQRNGRG